MKHEPDCGAVKHCAVCGLDQRSIAHDTGHPLGTGRHKFLPCTCDCVYGLLRRAHDTLKASKCPNYCTDGAVADEYGLSQCQWCAVREELIIDIDKALEGE